MSVKLVSQGKLQRLFRAFWRHLKILRQLQRNISSVILELCAASDLVRIILRNTFNFRAIKIKCKSSEKKRNLKSEIERIFFRLNIFFQFESGSAGWKSKENYLLAFCGPSIIDTRGIIFQIYIFEYFFVFFANENFKQKQKSWANFCGKFPIFFKIIKWWECCWLSAECLSVKSSLTVARCSCTVWLHKITLLLLVEKYKMRSVDTSKDFLI